MSPMDADDRLSPGNVGTSSRVVVHAMGQTRLKSRAQTAVRVRERKSGKRERERGM
jgi:hypothetical protein